MNCPRCKVPHTYDPEEYNVETTRKNLPPIVTYLLIIGGLVLFTYGQISQKDTLTTLGFLIALAGLLSLINKASKKL